MTKNLLIPKKLVFSTLILFYIFLGLEFILMISPFAIYFYAAYSPLLEKISASYIWGWLTAFFLPHIAFLDSPLLTVLLVLAPVLFIAGSVIFAFSAMQIYSAKIGKRETLVTSGFYSFVRHPQYTGLSLAGFGLLLFWPRFIILLCFIVMLFVYFLLSIEEEKVMRKEFKEEYADYRARTPAFVPGLRIDFPIDYEAKLSDRKYVIFMLIFILTVIGSVGLGFGLRQYSKSRLLLWSFKDYVFLPVLPKDRMLQKEIIDTVQAEPRIEPLLSQSQQNRPPTYLVYILPVYAGGQRIVNNAAPFLFNTDDIKDSDFNFIFRIRKIPDMFILGPWSWFYLRRMTQIRRLVFCKVFDIRNENVLPRDILGINTGKTPLLFLDIDIKDRRVVSLVKIPDWRSRNNIPMPLF